MFAGVAEHFGDFLPGAQAPRRRTKAEEETEMAPLLQWLKIAFRGATLQSPVPICVLHRHGSISTLMLGHRPTELRNSPRRALHGAIAR